MILYQLDKIRTTSYTNALHLLFLCFPPFCPFLQNSKAKHFSISTTKCQVQYSYFTKLSDNCASIFFNENYFLNKFTATSFRMCEERTHCMLFPPSFVINASAQHLSQISSSTHLDQHRSTKQYYVRSYGKNFINKQKIICKNL